MGELLGRISSRELTEWQAYYTLEPWGEERADLRTGIVAATVANANRDSKRRKRAYRPQEFMPKFGPSGQGWEQQLALVEQMNAALGGRDLRKRAD